MKHFASLLLFILSFPILAWSQDADDLPYGTYPDPKAPDGYYFTHQIIDLTVHRDRSIDVSEYIVANFLVPSHGIYRTIPKRFWAQRDVSEMQDGSKFEMRYNAEEISNLEVSDPFLPEDIDSLLDIRIGSADKMIEGRHPIRLNYTLTIPNDDRVDASDLFFHSIVGSGWDCSTDTVLFEIHFDDELPADFKSQLKVLCGPEGDEENKVKQILYVKDNHNLVGQYYDLKPNEALTIYLPLPDGFFDKGKTPIWYYLAWGMSIITLLMVLYLICLEVKGDEPVTKVVSFRPSQGLTSADVGSIVDSSIDDIDLLSLLPWMAAEGYISMTVEENGKTRIDLGKNELPSDAPNYVRSIYQGLFAKGNTFYIDKPTAAFGNKWFNAKQQLKAKYGSKLLDNTNMAKIMLAILSFAITYGFAQVSPEGVVMSLVMILLLTMELLFFLAWRLWKSFINFRNGCIAAFVSLIAIQILFIVFLTGTGVYIMAIYRIGDTYLPFNWLLGVGIATALVVMFASRLKRLSPLRRKYIGEVLGLKEFMHTAEKDRLAMLLNEDERYFYRILPYAMVFGMVDEWAKKFDGLTVQKLKEFSNLATSAMHNLLRSKDMNQLAEKSQIAAIPKTNVRRSSGHYHSSSGGSYHSASHHRSGYSGGGSGGGGGRRW